MTREIHRRELATAFARRLHDLGFETYLSKDGCYGFFTNHDASRIVTFQADHYAMGVCIYGAYEPSKNNGTGWRIYDGLTPPRSNDDVKIWLAAVPPFTRNPWTPYTTRNQHLARYQRSSKFKRVTS